MQNAFLLTYLWLQQSAPAEAGAPRGFTYTGPQGSAMQKQKAAAQKQAQSVHGAGGADPSGFYTTAWPAPTTSGSPAKPVLP